MLSIARSEYIIKLSPRSLYQSGTMRRMSCRYLSQFRRHQANDATSSKRNLPSEADVVVIGGGMVGSSTTYHLAKMTGGNIVQLERDKLTSGTTWHTAGESFKSLLPPRVLEEVTFAGMREFIEDVLRPAIGRDSTGAGVVQANQGLAISVTLIFKY